ncbi:hypothetical protein C8J56DRAFT_1095199 [Mycena floridula]|nr:hypothetical protein C8J56DRAFT_1095199 [Mycena floridula]
MFDSAAKFPLEEDVKSEWSAPRVTLGTQVPSPRSPKALLERLLLTLDPLKWICLIAHLVLIVFLFSLAFAPSLPPQEPGFRLPKHIPPFSLRTAFFVSGPMSIAVTGLISFLSIIMVTTTSGLTLRRQLHFRGTLTSKHDTAAAWSSLGSAAVTMLSRKPSAVRTSLVALLYLGGISLLHTFSSSLVSIHPVNELTPIIIATEGLPDFNQGGKNFVAGPGSLMTLDALVDFPLTGLDTDIVYDVPANNVEIMTNSLKVNATQFKVTCGAVSGRINQQLLSDGIERRQLVLDSVPDTPVTLDSFMSGSSVALYSSPWAELNDATDDSFFWPPTIFVVSTVPIIDNDGQPGPRIQLNPPLSYVPFGSQSTGALAQIQEATVLGCNLTLNENAVANISSRNYTLLELEGLVANNAVWADYPVASRGPLRLDLTDPVDALLTIWGQLPDIKAVSSLNDNVFSICNATQLNFLDGVCKSLYQPDQFIMESLDIYPDLIFDSGKSKSSASLSDLENALSIMSAKMFWFEAKGRNALFANELQFEQDPTRPVAQTFLQQHNSTVMEQVQLMRVNINLFFVYPLLILAFILLGLAMPGILDCNHLQVKSAGILQIIWLLQEHPEIQQTISQVEDPSTGNLRDAGMMEVCFGEKHGAEKQLWDSSA